MLKCRNEKQAETEKVEDACVIRRRREVSGNTMIILSAFIVYLLLMDSDRCGLYEENK